MNIILPFFSATQVILIDDHNETLQRFKDSLDHGLITCKTFSNPFAALDYINDIYNQFPTKQVTKSGNSLIDGNIKSAYEEIYSPNRFKQISAIITDYDMPGMDGLELCQKINSPHIQKIVLTGAASDKVAVGAFNNKTIDYFVQKNDPRSIEKLNNLIGQTQEKYFQSIASSMINALFYENPKGLNIANPNLIDIFQRIVRENRICEYYLLENNGSTLFLNADGEASALFVYDKLQLGNQEDLIPEREITEEILQEISNNRKAICHYDFKNYSAYNPSDWKELLHPIYPLEDAKDYFWAYAPSLPYLKKEGIVSFKEYKQAINNE